VPLHKKDLPIGTLLEIIKQAGKSKDKLLTLRRMLIGIATSFSSWINEHPKNGFSHINWECK